MSVESDSDEEIRQQVTEWSSSSNDSLTIELIRSDGSVTASFQPAFTYPIFGEEEVIFGYHDLEIALTFAAHNLQPHLAVSYSQKFKHPAVEPTNIHEALREFLPEAAFSTISREEALKANLQASFSPPGERIHTYERNGDTFQIWCASLADPAAKTLLENMQILVPMFIEGGTILQLEQDWTTDRWKLFLIYQIDSCVLSMYSLVGYGTSYRVFTLPERQESQLPTESRPTNAQASHSQGPSLSIQEWLGHDSDGSNASGTKNPLNFHSRERLSQFLILPPFQSSGHGRELYNTMYAHLTEPANVLEFTVEDPNEAFDDLRDLCDLLRLRNQESDFAALHINTDISTDNLRADEAIPIDRIVDGKMRAALQRKTKIMSRQFDRLVEMHTLSAIPPMHRSRSRITRKEKASNIHDRAYYLWRLYAKQRLYIFNRDSLAQLEPAERIEKLEAALDSVQEAYVNTLERVEAAADTSSYSNGSTPAKDSQSARPLTSRPAKRKIIEEGDDDDDEEEGEDDDAEGAGHDTERHSNGNKKPRLP